MAARSAILHAKVAADVRSFIRLQRLVRGRGPETTDVALTALGGNRIRLRRGTSDVHVVTETFADCYHLPQQPPPTDSVILDLGANIGLTACHFAHLYPGCTTIAVEMDPANASLAEINVRPWSDRVRVINAAVWTESGTIAYRGEPGNEYGYAVDPEGGKTVEAVTLDQLTEGQNIAYLKMDIEGAEEQVLSPGGWVDRVRCMKVEVHAPFTTERCIAVLQALGFAANADERHWSAVVARRG